MSNNDNGSQSVTRKYEYKVEAATDFKIFQTILDTYAEAGYHLHSFKEFHLSDDEIPGLVHDGFALVFYRRQIRG